MCEVSGATKEPFKAISVGAVFSKSLFDSKASDCHQKKNSGFNIISISLTLRKDKTNFDSIPPLLSPLLTPFSPVLPVMSDNAAENKTPEPCTAMLGENKARKELKRKASSTEEDNNDDNPPKSKQLKKIITKKGKPRGIVSIPELLLLRESGNDVGLNVSITPPINTPHGKSKLSYANLSTLLHTLLLQPQVFGSTDKFCTIKNPAALEGVNVVFLNHDSDSSLDALGEAITSAAQDSSVLSFSMSGKGGGNHLWESVFQKPILSNKALKSNSKQPALASKEIHLLQSLRSLKLTRQQTIANGYTTLKEGRATPNQTENGLCLLSEDDIVLGVDEYSR